MNVIPTEIPDVLVLEPKVFGDDRGFFYESYNEKLFRELTGVCDHFVQDNHSRSVKGVLRGLHYQLPPNVQGKLVRCLVGEVFDVAVDVRKRSPTFGKWVGVFLTAENKRMMWIPGGFAHGFLTLSESAEFAYKTTNYYSPECERSILWNDKDLEIAWPWPKTPILSAKDAIAQSFSIAEVF